MTFKEKYLAREIEFEAIDDFIDIWNNSDDERTLAKFLGLNAEEEDVWIDDSDEALKELLDKQRALAFTNQQHQERGTQYDNSNIRKHRYHSQQEWIWSIADPENF